jgi:hypothetical protein
MDTLQEIDWSRLTDAYGPAEGIPALLRRAETDTRPGHIAGSTWFDLWSALCHQGDIYTASYAAVPHLVNLASHPTYHTQYDPLYLAASIHVRGARGEPPSIPEDLVVAYRRALPRGLELAKAALQRPLDNDSRKAFQGCVAAFHGGFLTAEDIWEEEG